MNLRGLLEQLLGLALVGLVLAIVLSVALPAGYVIRVAVSTGSRPLLATIAAGLGVAALAAMAGAFWLAALMAAAILVVARVEEVRLDSPLPPGDGLWWLPDRFGDHHR